MALGIAPLAAVALGLMTLCVAAIPLNDRAPVIAWSFLLIAVLAGRGAPVHPSTEPVDRPDLRRPLGLWIVMALTACMIGSVMGMWHGEGFRTMRQDGKLLLVALLLWALTQKGHRAPHWLPSALGIALVAQMLSALAATMLLPRAALPMGPIPWATAVALGAAVIAPWVFRRSTGAFSPLRTGTGFGPIKPFDPNRAGWRAVLAIALAAGLVAVILSRSRGAWVILPWLMVLVTLHSSRPWRTLLIVVGAGTMALAAAIHHDAQQSADHVERGLRVLDLWEELGQWSAPDPGTSIGSRLLLWQAAWDSLMTHPWTGIGQAARAALVQQVVPPSVLPDVDPLVHVHQQFLNQAVDHGLPGLMAALLSAGALAAAAWTAPAGPLRWQWAGIAVVHTGGLLFNANMTHGPYVFTVAMAMATATLMHSPGRAGH